MSPLTKRPACFTEASLDDETVLMRLDTGEFYSLSATATAIWKKIDGTRDRDALLADLADEFGAPEGTLQGDVDVFLAEMTALGFVDGP